MTSLDISIHALREEGDVVSVGGFQHPFLFLSTPSARRATGTITYLGSTMMISIHALREEGDNSTFMAFSTSAMISIHALREEGDPTVAAALQAKTEFLSTPSARRATERYGERVMSDKFLSTPSARRATSDGRCPSVPARNFYPRPPRGGRPTATVGETDSYEFLSTPSARRATHLRRCAEDALKISIHALREEGDVFPPAGAFVQKISIHALREEGDARPRRSL